MCMLCVGVCVRVCVMCVCAVVRDLIFPHNLEFDWKLN